MGQASGFLACCIKPVTWLFVSRRFASRTAGRDGAVSCGGTMLSGNREDGRTFCGDAGSFSREAGVARPVCAQEGVTKRRLHTTRNHQSLTSEK